MAWYNRNKKVTQQEPKEDKSFEGFRTVNTEGKDLSQPFVDDYYNRGYSWVFFGADNLHPQIWNQLYISSPMHQACCNFKKYALTGEGYEWENYDTLSPVDKVRIKTFERTTDFKSTFTQMALDWIKHGRITVLMRYDKEKKEYSHFIHLDPANIRNNQVDIFKKRPTKYFYSKDWQRSFAEYTFAPYSKDCTDEYQVLELRNNVGGFKAYGMPDWMSSANWQNVGSDLGLLHKSAIENGIQPSIIFNYPYLMTPEERDQWNDGMRQNGKGASNYGRAMKTEANGVENLPKIEVVKTSDNHKLFQQTSSEYKEETAISHNINPALMGVRIAGSLGQTEEIEFSARQFEKVWLNSNREKLQDFVNDICRICKLPTSFEILPTEVIQVSNKDKEQPQQSEALEISVNDNLRGLSAGENSDIYRIIRDYKKGRLTYTIARTRIQAYGINRETADEILNEDE